MKPIVCAAILCVAAWAQPKAETGELNGAKFRIDVPESWNGTLVMYCHGYNPKPVTYDNPKPSAVLETFVKQGCAVAQSGYAAGGWAIQEAVNDTEALRRYFITKYGKPQETYVTGHSMGGFLTMTLMEMFPNVYDGGLPLCGPLAPASWFMERRVFDLRVVFDYYFPDALPSPAKVPSDYVMSPQLNATLMKLLESKPPAAAAMRRWSGIKTDKELVGTAGFFTYILKDLQERSGGNPFDNRNTIYEGTDDDNALNDGVKRYEADPRASEYVRRFYTPTGKIARAMLHLHTTYDPLVPAWTPNMYTKIAQDAGRADLFAQRYVKRDGHCTMLPAEVERAFADLREWKRTGQRPGN
jgi:pimeloyl-ACP methyl ester carboxylesterase